MATDSAHRGVSIDRIAAGQFTARHDFGGRIAIGTGGDAVRAGLPPDAVRRSPGRLCTVSHTVELGIPITSRVRAG
jgi:hypothetical protein